MTPGGEGASVAFVSDGEQGLGGVIGGTGNSGNSPFGKRAREWFWRSEALSKARGTIPQRREPAFAWLKFAKQSDALAHVAWTTSELGGEGAACELYRQSAYWSLRALHRSTLGNVAAPEYSASVWNALDDRLLSPIAATAEEREAFRARLAGASFVHFAELPRAEQTALCLQLRTLAGSLLKRVAEERSGFERVRWQRALRVGLPALLLLVLVGAVALRLGRSDDLAEGTSWKASSVYTGGGGCPSPEQTCAVSANGWFFHTVENDRDPWIEFELNSVKDISQVEVENRSDCCADRSAGLIVEVSLDHNSWQQVARRDKEFSVWRARFPSVKASWVRLHLPHKGTLHLKRVHIYK